MAVQVAETGTGRGSAVVLLEPSWAAEHGIGAFLRDEGLAVRTASSGAEALAQPWFQAASFDFLLVEESLIDFDVCKLAEALRSRSPSLQVVRYAIASGRPGEARAAADAPLRLPRDLDAFLARIGAGAATPR